MFNVCKTPGMKIRSGGMGRGLGKGRGRGPIRLPIGQKVGKIGVLRPRFGKSGNIIFR